MTASWTGNTEEENEKVKQENIIVLELKAAFSKSQEWKSP